jgi:hypothetical protein
VLADETRPVLQGARLTAWELQRDGIPVEVIADNMAGALMSRGEIQAAIVGADRITRRGDVANKIGTYTVAVLCRYHGLPFFVAAPWSTIDMTMESGRGDPDRAARPGRGAHARRDAHDAGRGGREEPGLRRDAGRAGDGDHHGARGVHAGAGRLRRARPQG